MNMKPRVTKLDMVLLVLAVLVCLLAVYALHVMAERFLTEGVRHAVGSPVSIADIRIDWSRSRVGLYGLRVGNPQGFKTDTLAYVPEITFRFNPRALRQGKIHIEELSLTCQQVAIEKNARNWVNLLEIGVVRERFDQSDSTASMARKRGDRFRMERAVINVARGTVADYSLGREPSVREFAIDVKGASLKDIRDPDQLALYVVLAAILKVGWQTLNPDPMRLPQALLMQGDALVAEVSKIFSLSEEDLKILLQGP